MGLNGIRIEEGVRSKGEVCLVRLAFRGLL